MAFITRCWALTCAQPGPLSPRAHAQTLQHSPPSTARCTRLSSCSGKDRLPGCGRPGDTAQRDRKSSSPPQANLVAFLTHQLLTKAASSCSWLCQVHGTQAHTVQGVLPACPSSSLSPLLWYQGRGCVPPAGCGTALSPADRQHALFGL